MSWAKKQTLIFKPQLSGGMLSSRVNHYLPMNTSNWVRAFVFGCGSEGKATEETVLAFVVCVLKVKKPCSRDRTRGHPTTLWVTSPGSRPNQGQGQDGFECMCKSVKFRVFCVPK